MQTPFLFDAHCHLGLMADAESIASQLEAAGLGVFDCGVDPREYEATRERAQCHTGIVTGVGLHPWWIADVLCDEAEISLLCDIASRERFVGEVGLDFGRRGLPAGHEDEARAQQLAAFERLCETIATHPLSGRVLSIHAVNAAGTVLDILEQNGLLKADGPDDASSPVIIFHWFSGASNDLTRARNVGCFFSFNERMLATKRGREYAKQIRENQLLIETDYPCSPDNGCSADDLRISLERTLRMLAEIRRFDALSLAEVTTANAKSLFCF